MTTKQRKSLYHKMQLEFKNVVSEYYDDESYLVGAIRVESNKHYRDILKKMSDFSLDYIANDLVHSDPHKHQKWCTDFIDTAREELAHRIMERLLRNETIN